MKKTPYLGIATLHGQDETKAQEYFERSLRGQPDPFFRYRAPERWPIKASGTPVGCINRFFSSNERSCC